MTKKELDAIRERITDDRFHMIKKSSAIKLLDEVDRLRWVLERISRFDKERGATIAADALKEE